jgi:hypothetical protein
VHRLVHAFCSGVWCMHFAVLCTAVCLSLCQLLCSNKHAAQSSSSAIVPATRCYPMLSQHFSHHMLPNQG